MVPGGEEEDERAGLGAAGPQRRPAAEAGAGDGGHRLSHEQQRERGATQRRGGIGAVHAVGPLLPAEPGRQTRRRGVAAAPTSEKGEKKTQGPREGKRRGLAHLLVAATAREQGAWRGAGKDERA